MPTTIDYAKYANMNKRTIFNHLLKAEAKLTNLEENFKEKISEQKELAFKGKKQEIRTRARTTNFNAKTNPR